MLPTGERSTLVVIKLRNRLQERSGKGNASGDLHCVDGMLEGVSREAGPFEFVVCADGARVGLGLRAWAGGRRGARAWDCARVPRTVRVGQWTTGCACPWRWRSGTVRAGQWTTGCAGLELCARAPLLAALTH